MMKSHKKLIFFSSLHMNTEKIFIVLFFHDTTLLIKILFYSKLKNKKFNKKTEINLVFVR